MRLAIGIFCLVLLSHFSMAQQEILPKFLTSQERKIVDQGIYKPYQSSQITAPPGVVRTPAEWEPMQSVIITWQGFNSILSEIVKYLKDDVEVIIVCDNMSNVKTYLGNKGIDYSENVSFYEIPSNSLWVRDYGPNSGYLEETGELVWIDWIYNRPRYKDDQVPQQLGAFLNIPVYETSTAPEDLVNTGGNFMADGLGTAFSSDLVLDENGANNQYGTSNHSEVAVDSIMNQYMGIDEYIKMEALPYDLIHHIDMHMKLIDEETILVGEYPEGIADGPQIEANIQYILDQYQTAYGRPFNIKRIPMPPGPDGNYPNQGDDYRTYANALIANSTIIVPTYTEEYDTTALRIWSELMPGYNVQGINCNQIIPLSGALHCITKEVAVSESSQISMKKEESWCANETFVFEVQLNTKQNVAAVNFVLVEDGSEEPIAMNMVSEGIYSIDLESYAEGSSIEYFIRVELENGDEILRPFVGADGPRKTEFIDCGIVSNLEEVVAALNVFPNPASAITCVEVEQFTNEPIRIELINMLGQVVETLGDGQRGNSTIGGDKRAYAQKYFFNAQDFAKGQYTLRITVGNEVVYKSVTIQ